MLVNGKMTSCKGRVFIPVRMVRFMMVDMRKATIRDLERVSLTFWVKDDMRVHSWMDRDQERVCWSHKTKNLDTRGNGNKTRGMARERSSSKMNWFMKEILLITHSLGMEFFMKRMDRSMKGNLSKTRSRV